MINNGFTTLAEYIPSPNIGGPITPKFIVMHYTAGYTTESAVRTFQNTNSRVSAHLVIGRDGKVVQMVPYTTRAWHAGPSSYMGYSGLNGHSIGIELVNIGYLKKTPDSNVFMDSYGRNIEKRNLGNYIEAPEPRIGSGTFVWHMYTGAQLEALHAVVDEILGQYAILDIVSHQEIDTRGWKTDPGPAFPMNAFKVKLRDRLEDKDQYQVTASTLNIRGGPSTLFSVIGSVKKDTVVDVLEWSDKWARISQDGWVYGGYLKRWATI